ncbi:MAG: type II secretion system protein GspG [Phycisphaerales bacterium]
MAATKQDGWMQRWVTRSLAAGTLVAACGLAVTPSALAINDEPEHQLTALEELATAPWIRTVQTPEGVLQMQVAVRTLQRRDGTGPKLIIAGAVHIGDRPYYQALHDLLDPLDLVLYEGVLPAGAAVKEPANDAEARKLTEQRLRLLATLAFQMGDDAAEAESVDDLISITEDRRKAADLLRVASIDGWGNPIQLVRRDNGSLDFVSFGSDGEHGGEGDNADLKFSDQRPLAPAERGEIDGIQTQLASALGLHFQLEEMEEDGPNWRNADMSASQIERRVAELGGDASALFDQLGGTGLPAQLLGMVLRLVETFPGAQARAKMMLMDMLAQTEILEIGLPGPDGQALMQVIIDERNQVIVDRLLEALPEAAENGWETIGIIYGAGHMPDLLERLDDQVGYRVDSGGWNTAITLDLEAAGISMRERAMYKRQIEMQMKTMARQLERERRVRDRE